MAWRLVSGSFQFSKNPPRKESEEACVQIFGQNFWTNFDSFANTYNA